MKAKTNNFSISFFKKIVGILIPGMATNINFILTLVTLDQQHHFISAQASMSLRDINPYVQQEIVFTLTPNITVRYDYLSSKFLLSICFSFHHLKQEKKRLYLKLQQTELFTLTNISDSSNLLISLNRNIMQEILLF
jgi:hypothetical protein